MRARERKGAVLFANKKCSDVSVSSYLYAIIKRLRGGWQIPSDHTQVRHSQTERPTANTIMLPLMDAYCILERKEDAYPKGKQLTS